MDIEGKLNQRCLLWRRIGKDEFGIGIYSDPIEIFCRWEERMELFLSTEGVQELSRAVVYSLTDMSAEDVLWLGTLEDFEPFAEMDLREFTFPVRRVDIIPDIRAEIYLRMAYL